MLALDVSELAFPSCRSGVGGPELARYEQQLLIHVATIGNQRQVTIGAGIPIRREFARCMSALGTVASVALWGLPGDYLAAKGLVVHDNAASRERFDFLEYQPHQTSPRSRGKWICHEGPHLPVNQVIGLHNRFRARS